MSDDKGDAHRPDADPDRAAILARRQRFIAIALSSLASAAACKPRAQPCLNVVDIDEGKTPEGRPEGQTDGQPEGQTDGQTDDGGTPPEDPATPRPCLEVAAPPDDDKAPPRPCLKVAAPKEDPAPPRPCLKVAPG